MAILLNRREAKNRGADGGGWCEEEFPEEAGEEPVKVALDTWKEWKGDG